MGLADLPSIPRDLVKKTFVSDWMPWENFPDHPEVKKFDKSSISYIDNYTLQHPLFQESINAICVSMLSDIREMGQHHLHYMQMGMSANELEKGLHRASKKMATGYTVAEVVSRTSSAPEKAIIIESLLRRGPTMLDTIVDHADTTGKLLLGCYRPIFDRYALQLEKSIEHNVKGLLANMN